MKKRSRNIVITGGEGALAKAIAEAFRDETWNVFTPSHATLDVENPTAVASYFHERKVDLLVCAAGIIRDAPMARMNPVDWEKTFAVNFTGASLCARAVLPGMVGRENGHIVFISSYSALHPPVGQAAYATAKAALLGLTKDLARLHGPHGIRINTILPGFLETPMTAYVSSHRLVEIREAHVLGEFNTAHHTASFIRHLHEHLPHTSGQAFQLDSRPGR